MPEKIIVERNSDTSRALWAASWAIEKLAREIGDVTSKDMTETDLNDVYYFVGILNRRMQNLVSLVPTESL